MSKKQDRAYRPSEAGSKMVRRSDGTMVPNDAYDPALERASQARAEQRGGGKALRESKPMRKERPTSTMGIRQAQAAMRKVRDGDFAYIDSNPEEVAEAYGLLEARYSQRQKEIEKLEAEIASRCTPEQLGRKIPGQNGDAVWIEDNRHMRFNAEAAGALLTDKETEECSSPRFSQSLLEEKYPEEYNANSFCTGGFYAKRQHNEDDDWVDYKNLKDPDSFLGRDLSKASRAEMVSRLARLSAPARGTTRKNAKGEDESLSFETAEYQDMRNGLATYGAQKIGGVNEGDSVALAYERIKDHGLEMESPQGVKIQFHPNRKFDKEHWTAMLEDKFLEEGSSEKVAARKVARRVAEVTPMKIDSNKVKEKYPKKWEKAREQVGKVQTSAASW